MKYNETWIPQRADPYVIKVDGWYYFTASVPEYDRIAIRRAKSLEALANAEEMTIWKKHESGIMSQHVWAPEIHKINGTWYVYFAASRVDDIWALRPYALKCTGEDPFKDEWVECGMLKAASEDPFSFNDFSLDSTVFENNGAWYIVWAEKVNIGKKISNLYIARLKNPTELDTAQVLLTTPDYDWERVGFWVNEGPAVLKREGKIFLTYSASETGVCYCLGMLSASADSDLLDRSSWKKERYPVLESSGSHGIYGPGHNSFTVDEDGRDVMVYHARTETEIIGDPLYNPNRHTMIMPLVWSKEGAPVFSFDNQ